MKPAILLVMAMSLVLGNSAIAQMPQGGYGSAAHDRTMTVEAPWARASVGRNGAAFVTVINKSADDDRLVGAKSDVSPRVELHTSSMDGNVMRMRRLDAIPVPAGKTVALKPGGMHVMMIGLTQKLVEGETFPLTLVFEKAGEIIVTVPIMKIGAMGGGHGGMTR